MRLRSLPIAPHPRPWVYRVPRSGTFYVYRVFGPATSASQGLRGGRPQPPACGRTEWGTAGGST